MVVVVVVGEGLLRAGRTRGQVHGPAPFHRDRQIQEMVDVEDDSRRRLPNLLHHRRPEVVAVVDEVAVIHGHIQGRDLDRLMINLGRGRDLDHLMIDPGQGQGRGLISRLMVQVVPAAATLIVGQNVHHCFPKQQEE